MTHTTRPELRGTFGMVSATHWLAAQVGMAMLERGGNAFDAAAAAGFTMQVVEPHQNGPGGDLNLLHSSPGASTATVLCGQGPAPRAASIEAFRGLGVDLVPGTGSLAAAVPGAFVAWLTLLRDRGTMRLADVLAPAAGYARDGYPAAAKVVEYITRMADYFTEHWPSSAAVYLPNGAPPRVGELIRNTALADTLDRLLAVEAAAVGRGAGREGAIDACIDEWTGGFVAAAVDAFVRVPVRDSTGTEHAGFLTADDLAAWRPAEEPAVTMSYRGRTVCKAGLWSQGPVLLQQLSLIGEDAPLPGTADAVHRTVEASKLAFADRDAWYGDLAEVTVDELLDGGYAAQRQALIGPRASLELRPGSPGGRTPRLPDLTPRGAFDDVGLSGLGEPNAVSALLDTGPRADGESRSDTVHVDVVDRWGNMVAAMPSGGWLHSAPIIPALGFPLGTRLQMSWLEEGLPNSLRPWRRPRTTLSPSIVLEGDQPVLAFGSPGGDQQDQWGLHFLLNVLVGGMNLQEAIDAPAFHSTHTPSSFYPHSSQPGVVVMEQRFGDEVIDDLRRRGHRIGVSGPWEIGRLCAVGRSGDGRLVLAGANARGMQGYAVGR